MVVGDHDWGMNDVDMLKQETCEGKMVLMRCLNCAREEPLLKYHAWMLMSYERNGISCILHTAVESSDRWP